MKILELSGIVGYHFTYDSIKSELSKLKKGDSVTINLRSPGGAANEAMQIYELLKDYDVTVNIIGMCASAATVISQAAAKGKLFISEISGEYLVHQARYDTFSLMFAYSGLKTQDLDDLKSGLEISNEQQVNIFTDRNVKKEVVLDAISNETVFSPKQAVELGFVDGYIEDKQFAKNALQKSNAVLMATLMANYENKDKNSSSNLIDNEQISNNNGDGSMEIKELTAKLESAEQSL